MTHHEAVQQAAVEKYLLNQMSSAERDEFEEHYFSCPECAADLRITAEFLDHVKEELQHGVAGQSRLERAPAGNRSRTAFFWSPAFAGSALALLLLVIVYQNFPTTARVARGTTGVDRPEILTTLSLIGAGSRGALMPSLTVPKGQPVLVMFDIPATERYSSYDCTLIAPGGAVLWRLSVSPERAKDTLSLRVPAEHWERGNYTLLVQGFAQAARETPVDVATFRFTVNTSD